MQAIVTRVIPATNTKPTRIKASCARGSLVVAPNMNNYGETSEQAHEFVARYLTRKFALADREQYGTPIEANPWERPFVTGSLPSGDYVHVFTGAK